MVAKRTETHKAVIVEQVPVVLWRQARARAALEGSTMRRVIVELLTEYVRPNGKPKGSKNKLTRERVEQELRYLALSDPLALFDRVAKGQRTFQLREIHAMSEEMRRCIASVKVKTENLTAGDGAQDTTVEVRLWDKTK